MNGKDARIALAAYKKTEGKGLGCKRQWVYVEKVRGSNQWHFACAFCRQPYGVKKSRVPRAALKHECAEGTRYLALGLGFKAPPAVPAPARVTFAGPLPTPRPTAWEGPRAPDAAIQALTLAIEAARQALAALLHAPAAPSPGAPVHPPRASA